MLPIEQIEDREHLRRVATLLEKENHKLHDKIRALAAENAQLKGLDLSGSQMEMTYLRELLAARERSLFGDSSERRPRGGGDSKAAEKPKAKPRGHGPRIQSQLSIVECEHELAPTDRCCTQCGRELTEMSGQSEDSEEITVIERRFVLVKHRRKKYRCACNGQVATAPAPLKLAVSSEARGRRYSIEFAIEVAVGKYLDHLPLERQVRMMNRDGLLVDSQTLWDQIEALARVLAPAEKALRQRVLTSPVIGADETWWRLMAGKYSKDSKRWWAWVLAVHDAVSYRIVPSRSKDAAREVLGGYRGQVMADGYGAYQALAKENPDFVLAHCWAHVRRKYVEAEPHFPGPCAEILDLIGQLYGVEREEVTSLEARAALRNGRSRPIVEQIRAFAFSQRALPQSSLGKANAYLMGMWSGLVRFLDHPLLPLDNNATERALRGAVLGRNNHYGSRSQRGTEVAALFYSLLETTKLVDVEPKRYLLEATRAALQNQVALLPHQLVA